jgi:hypothetical protein
MTEAGRVEQRRVSSARLWLIWSTPRRRPVGTQEVGQEEILDEPAIIWEKRVLAFFHYIAMQARKVRRHTSREGSRASGGQRESQRAR